MTRAERSKRKGRSSSFIRKGARFAIYARQAAEIKRRAPQPSGPLLGINASKYPDWRAVRFPPDEPPFDPMRALAGV